MASAGDPDGNALTFTVVEGPAHGTTSVVGGHNKLAPQERIWGTSTFKVRVLDGITSHGWTRR